MLNLDDLALNQNVGNHKYRLIGIINHFGGISGGHYTAFCRNQLNNKWYDFDDSDVTEISKD